MKTLKLITLFLFVFASLGYAQDDSSMLSKLKENKWIMKEQPKVEEVYSKKNRSCYYDGQYIGDFEFYLSDSADKVFDSKKVGKVANGKYIIYRAQNDTSDKDSLPVTCVEIIKLNSDTLIIEAFSVQYHINMKHVYIAK